MLKSIINYSALNSMLHLLFKLFNIRITFFDLKDYEPGYFDIKPLSKYCARRRDNKAFEARCIACDKKHLALAKKQREILLYTCHSGLYEAIVPLYDKELYLGSIVFGQIRVPGAAYPKAEDKRYKKLFGDLPAYTGEYLLDLAKLLKYISEYIIIKEIINYRKKEWVENINGYISKHINERITLSDLSHLLHRSDSFVSHYFKKEFGVAPLRYIREAKLKLAKERIEQGENINTAAPALGFYDEYHFSKLFKKFFGYSPSRLKK